MALNGFQRTSFRVLGGQASKMGDVNKLRSDLRRARLGVRVEAYIATTILFTLISVGVGLVFSLFLFLGVVPKLLPSAPKAIMIFIPVLPMVLGATTYSVLMSAPASKAKQRAKGIDAKLPYAINFIAAMASAGVNIDQVFRSLAEQEIYGECAREAAGIYRDMTYFGKDAITAMRNGIERTPSDRFQEFLQGAITTTTSGGDLQVYFSSKAERFMWENRQNQKQFVEMMGLMAETYVTACVAGPLFLIVMMSIMGMLGGGGASRMNLIVYVLLPIANLGFAYALFAMTPEV